MNEPSTDIELSVRDITTGYGSSLVLDHVSLDIHRGEALAIIGPSGDGKTTLLKCLNLLQPMYSGEIIFRGSRIASGPDLTVDGNIYRQSVGMVYQEFNLWPNKTVIQNLITAPVHVLNMKRSDALSLAHDWLHTFGLEGLDHRYPIELSGGQRQRVALARALMMDPSILLLDEVTSALDVEATAQLLRLFESLRDGKRTFIFVSHHLNFAERATDRVAVLIEGKIREIGPSAQIINSPQTDRTSQFLSILKESW